MDGDEACLQCHEPLRADPAAHTRHAPESAGSRCYNCHMPYTSYGLLKAIRSHTVGSPSAAETAEVGRPNACNLCHLDKTLAWTAERLDAWYGVPAPPLRDGDRTVAAGLRWMLAGDAGQRALTAWSMGWGPAQEASGTTWMVPHLGEALGDPYDAVRFIAAAHCAVLPGYAKPRVRLHGPPAGPASTPRSACSGSGGPRPPPGSGANPSCWSINAASCGSTPCGGCSTPATGGPSFSENSGSANRPERRLRRVATSDSAGGHSWCFCASASSSSCCTGSRPASIWTSRTRRGGSCGPWLTPTACFWGSSNIAFALCLRVFPDLGDGHRRVVSRCLMGASVLFAGRVLRGRRQALRRGSGPGRRGGAGGGGLPGHRRVPGGPRRRGGGRAAERRRRRSAGPARPASTRPRSR